MAQVSLLKQVAGLLAEMVGQHANRKLICTDFHREILDSYGGLESLRNEFTAGWNEEKALRSELKRIRNSEAERLREIEVCHRELNEIDEAHLKEGEEEELFTEYTLLSNAGELIEKTSQTLDSLSFVTHLNRTQCLIDDLAALDPSLQEVAKGFKSAKLEMAEVAYTLEQYRSRTDHNPVKADSLNDRLAVINGLKKKYGSTISEIKGYHTEKQQRLSELEDTDSIIGEIELKLDKVTKRNHAIAETLTEKRQQAGKNFEEATVSQLRSLNMPKVQFSVCITKQERHRLGDDKVEFFLIPNVGEKKIPITDCASGGELSRLVLAVHTLLAGKNRVATLIFDEVDANIGGETAAKVGTKLTEVAKGHQVICITHFPQVAKSAQHHLQIFKRERDGRTVTHVQILTDSQREKELKRMLGGAELLESAHS